MSPQEAREEALLLLPKFKDKRILVIGDVMIDAYLKGKVDRISPEAPVPIVHLHEKEFRLGGAANVALNLVSLSSNATLVGLVGEDSDALMLANLCKDSGIQCHFVETVHRPTTVKTRVISGKNQLLRIDQEVDTPSTEEEEDALIAIVLPLIQGHDGVLIEDYDKGTLGAKVIHAIMKEAALHNVKVAVDPKKRNFMHYIGAALFKPNLREMAEGLKIDIESLQTMRGVQDATANLAYVLDAEWVLTTLSERGVYLYSASGGTSHIPAHIRQIYDVSGAGDTVISVATLCLLCGASPEVMAGLANLAGGLVCEKPGVVPLYLSELEQEVLDNDLFN